MGKDWKETKSFTLTPAEVEKMLQNDFGDKLNPVNGAKLAEQRRQRARFLANKEHH